jgi:MscS family membrane protein
VSLKFAGTPLWRWIALVLLAIGLISFSGWLSRIVLYFAEQVMKRVAPRAALTDLHRLIGPLRLLVTVTLFRAGSAWIVLANDIQLYLNRGLGALFLIGVAWLGAAIVDVVVSRLHSRLESKHRAFSYSVLPLTSRVLKLAILLLAIVVVLTEWGYHATTLLAGLGVGGVAIALAAQKTLENFFGSVSVIGDRPVAVGDFCQFGDRTGVVEDVGIRSTRIRTADRTLVTVPNAQFSTMVLENFSRRDKMLFHLVLHLRQSTTPEQVRNVLSALTEFLKSHPKVEAGNVPVRFTGIGTYSLDVEVFVYLLTLDGDEFMQIQQNLLLRILDTIEAAGTTLAVPTQANINYAPPDTAPMQNTKPDGTNVAGSNGNPTRA